MRFGRLIRQPASTLRTFKNNFYGAPRAQKMSAQRAVGILRGGRGPGHAPRGRLRLLQPRMEGTPRVPLAGPTPLWRDFDNSGKAVSREKLKVRQGREFRRNSEAGCFWFPGALDVGRWSLLVWHLLAG